MISLKWWIAEDLDPDFVVNYEEPEGGTEECVEEPEVKRGSERLQNCEQGWRNMVEKLQNSGKGYVNVSDQEVWVCSL